MSPSRACKNLIKSFEGLKLIAYPDIVKKWTIGYGHTGFDVYEGLSITADQADKFLEEDMESAGSYISYSVITEISQGQFDALTDFVFNLGRGHFCSSTLLKMLNMGAMQAAADEFPKWIYAGGHIVPDLVRRREAERKIFLGITG